MVEREKLTGGGDVRDKRKRVKNPTGNPMGIKERSSRPRDHRQGGLGFTKRLG